MMAGYLGIDYDIIEDAGGLHAVSWYSRHGDRVHEVENGPIERRVTNQLGSGTEMRCDMRGVPI